MQNHEVNELKIIYNKINNPILKIVNEYKKITSKDMKSYCEDSKSIVVQVDYRLVRKNLWTEKNLVIKNLKKCKFWLVITWSCLRSKNVLKKINIKFKWEGYCSIWVNVIFAQNALNAQNQNSGGTLVGVLINEICFWYIFQ